MTDFVSGYNLTSCAFWFGAYGNIFNTAQHLSPVWRLDRWWTSGRGGTIVRKSGVHLHVRTCKCTPHLTWVNLSSNGSLAAHRVRTQSAQPFARYWKRVCTCARVDTTHPDLCKARIYWAPSHTQNLNVILPAVCEIWKRGVHVRTCRCTPPQTCGNHLSNGSLVTHKIWTQSAQSFARCGGRVCTCARADALHLRHV